MKRLIGLIVILSTVVGYAMTNEPNIKQHPENKCLISVNTSSPEPIEAWYICITDSTYVALKHFDPYDTCDGNQVGIEEFNKWIDYSQYIRLCEAALDNESKTFGEIKSLFR